MRIRIVVAYVPRYRQGHRWHFVPPVTGVHLAAITPPEHQVEVVHEQVRPVPIRADVDVVALSFFSGFAERAYEIADAYRALGVTVVAGGPHVSYWSDEALAHVDAVVMGEAEDAWPALLADLERGTLKSIYKGGEPSLKGLPTPRYELLEPTFLVPRVLQATRGCPFSCRFCSVPDLNPGFRVRPIDEVLRDVEAPVHPAGFAAGMRAKVAWFWDDNLLVKRRWAKDLLRGMRGMDRWWLTQASIDIVRDRELLDLMEVSGCAGIFLGIEAFDAEALESVDKRQNRIDAYRDAVARLHDRGICVMAGFISGFDNQTPADIVRVADRLQELEFDVPFLSILTPFRGTPLYDDLLREGRILEDRGWEHYNGYNVAFRPARMSPEALLSAHRALWDRAFSPRYVAGRTTRALRQLNAGGRMLSLAMNGFYGRKRIVGNRPRVAKAGAPVAHPAPHEKLVRLRRA
ncbi:MAG: radical SAM protein [Myxococcota bacterium]